MSIKSLLQLILLILIFFILGIIYFIYFYSGPLKEKVVINENVTKFVNKGINENNIDQEVLDDIISSDKENLNELNKNKNLNQIADEKNQKINIQSKNSKNNTKEEIKNLTKEIEYITSNSEGDTFKILAKYGKTNIENSNILDLETVDGIISSTKRSQIHIKSDHAKYNYDNQNSQFYSNVEIKYDNKIITCDNLDLQINQNYAIAYNNVKIKDDNSLMKAQIVTLNLLTKDIHINSQDKIKILTN